MKVERRVKAYTKIFSSDTPAGLEITHSKLMNIIASYGAIIKKVEFGITGNQFEETYSVMTGFDIPNENVEEFEKEYEKI